MINKTNRKIKVIVLFLFISVSAIAKSYTIDRQAVVNRNNPTVTRMDTLSSFSVGNGGFAFTVDATGLQSFPEYYSKGVPLGTMSDWGWHSFPNVKGYKPQEALKAMDFGRGHKELYSVQFKQAGRQKSASDWFRKNPHRLHLGIVGLELGNNPLAVKNIREHLNMWTGEITSHFSYKGKLCDVSTVCHPERDMIAAKIVSQGRFGVKFRFPYPTAGHCDDACRWNANSLHSTVIVKKGTNYAILRRTVDSTIYYVAVTWSGKAQLREKSRNYFVLIPKEDTISFSCEYLENINDWTASDAAAKYTSVKLMAANYWQKYWNTGAMVDFSACKDSRAKELERRVVLSQYLLAVNDAGNTPPQETGLTYNSWYGKFHLEMILWHQAQFALSGHPELLDRSLNWYFKAEPKAREIAARQGFEGVRWMKMTDPSGEEAPSNVGSYLIWQQPHLIYLAELLYRAGMKDALEKYAKLVDETAQFMGSFAEYDAAKDRYVLRGCIAAQETLPAATTVNPPFELSYWHFALQIAQTWRERLGEKRNAHWDDIINKLSPLAQKDSLYLAAETQPDTYKDIKMFSDHPAVLGAVGVLPFSGTQMNAGVMNNTFNWIWKNWNWDKTWGWDFPMVAMNAARLNQPEKAVDALLMNKRTNTYLKDGHNYQDERLRCYLPGNGGLLMAVSMMCAGWDGCNVTNPGFPKDGNWNVHWEGFNPMP